MSELRPFALIRDGDQWVRCSHEHTFLDHDAGIVELAWTTSTLDVAGAAPPLGAGLAFDNECRLYHSEPEPGRVRRLRWAAHDPLAPVTDREPPTPFLEGGPPDAVGDFAPAIATSALAQPRGLAVDINDRLFVAETGADRILVYDLWSERLLLKIGVPNGRPTALAAHGTRIYVVLAGTGTLARLSAGSEPVPCALPDGCPAPSRVAVSPAGIVAVITQASTADARVWFLDAARSGDDFPVPHATDLAWESDAMLVVARQSGADFLRFQVGTRERTMREPLRARAYDGLGIVATPEKGPCSGGGKGAASARRIGFWTAQGFPNAVPARLAYEPIGRLTTFRLDSGTYTPTP